MWLVYIPTSRSTVLEEAARKKEGFFSFYVATSKEVVYKETCSSLINAPMGTSESIFLVGFAASTSGSRSHLSWPVYSFASLSSKSV